MTNETQTAIDHLNASQVLHIADIPVIATHEDYTVRDYERFLPHPKRMQSEVFMLTLDSFINYVRRFGSADCSVLFINPTNATFVAKLDYHNAATGEAGWRDHRIYYDPPYSDEWDVWSDYSGKWLDQPTFAEFLEDNAGDVVEPEAAALIELANKMEIIKQATFKSARKTQTGEFQFAYAEENQSGTVEVPKQLKLGLKPFDDLPDHYEVVANLKYRLHEGAVKFCYELVKPKKIVKTVIKDMRLRVESELEDFQIYDA